MTYLENSGVFIKSELGTLWKLEEQLYLVYEDIFNAKNACDHLSGFNICKRNLVVLL